MTNPNKRKGGAAHEDWRWEVTTLKGPADPDEFRVKVGRYGARHYHDPLPADGTWEATDAIWPSVSTVKKAAGKDWSNVSLERAAKYLADKRHELDGMNAGEILGRLKEVNRAGLSRAGERGTEIHRIAEAVADGQELMTATIPDAAPYVPALRAFMEDHQPEWLLSEVVAINRSVGYGGTLDAVVQLGRQRFIIDWKTRSKEHGAYAEEGWQLAAYARCDYIIFTENGRAVRRPFPDVDGALIVSITTDGYRLFPVDTAKAWDGFKALRSFWSFAQADAKPIGKPIKLGANPIPQPADPFDGLSAPATLLAAFPGSDVMEDGRDVTKQTQADVDDRIRARVKRLSDAGCLEAVRDALADVGATKLSEVADDKRSRFLVLLTRAENDAALPYDDLDIDPVKVVVPEPVAHVADEQHAPERPAPDEGGPAGDDEVHELAARVRALNSAERQWADSFVAQATAAGVPISASRLRTTRRVACASAAAALSKLFVEDQSLALDVVAAVLGPDEVQRFSVGALIGFCTALEAKRLVAVCDAIHAGTASLTYADDGRPVVAA